MDLALPVQTCWPLDAGPLITWGLTDTRGPRSRARTSESIVSRSLDAIRVIMRWLAHRGGALDFPEIAARSQGAIPVAVALGADPATMLAAVTPIPDARCRSTSSPVCAARATELVKCLGNSLEVPATAEIYPRRRHQRFGDFGGGARTAITPGTTTKSSGFR